MGIDGDDLLHEIAKLLQCKLELYPCRYTRAYVTKTLEPEGQLRTFKNNQLFAPSLKRYKMDRINTNNDGKEPTLLESLAGSIGVIYNYD